MARKYKMARAALIAWVRGQLVPAGECLEWRGDTDRDGYGRVRTGGKDVRVHRLICEEAHGAPPADKPLAIHACDNPPCANPAHLRWGSTADNHAERGVRQRTARGTANGRSRLNEEAVEVIRFLAARGVSQARLARAHGVGETTIRNVVHRLSWA